MKIKLLFYLFFVLVSHRSIVHAQQWSYFKGFPTSVVFVEAEYDNLGRNYAISSKKDIWIKTSSSSWLKIPYSGVPNFKDIMVNKNTGTIFLADEQSGLVFTNNNGQTWQNAWLQNNATTGFKEGLNTLSNINQSNSFYSGGLSAFFPFAPRLFKYQVNGNGISSIQEIVFDSGNNSSSYPLVVHQSQDGSRVIVGTSSNGVWTSSNGGANFVNALSNHQVYAVIDGPESSYFALTLNLTTGQNLIMKSNDGLVWSVFNSPIVSGEFFTELFYDDVINELWVGSSRVIYKIQDLNSSNPTLVNQNNNNSEVFVTGITKTNNKVNLFSSQYTFQTSENSVWTQNLNGFTGSSSELTFDNSNNLYSLDYASPILSKTSESTTQWSNLLLDSNPIIGIDALKKDNLGNVYARRLNTIFKVSNSGVITTISSPILSAGFISKYNVSDAGAIYLVHSTNPSALYFSNDNGLNWTIIQQLPDSSDSYTSFEVDLNQTVYYTTSTNLTSFFFKTISSNAWTRVDYDTTNEINGCFTQNNLEKSRDKIFLRICGKTFFIENFQVGPQVQTPIGNDPSNLGTLIVTDNGLYTTALDGDVNKVYKSPDSGNTWSEMGCPNELLNYPVSLYNIIADGSNTIYAQTNPSLNLPTSIAGVYKLTETLSTPDFNSNIEVTIYPNPTSNLLNFSSASIIKRATVYDVAGRMVEVEDVTNNSIDVSTLQQGAYFLKLETTAGISKDLKFIKK